MQKRPQPHTQKKKTMQNYIRFNTKRTSFAMGATVCLFFCLFVCFFGAFGFLVLLVTLFAVAQVRDDISQLDKIFMCIWIWPYGKCWTFGRSGSFVCSTHNIRRLHTQTRAHAHTHTLHTLIPLFKHIWFLKEKPFLLCFSVVASAKRTRANHKTSFAKRFNNYLSNEQVVN